MCLVIQYKHKAVKNGAKSDNPGVTTIWCQMPQIYYGIFIISLHSATKYRIIVSCQWVVKWVVKKHSFSMKTILAESCQKEMIARDYRVS